jgi:hypothetical protein
VLNEKMNWNIKEKLSNIESNLDKYLRISRSHLRSMRDSNAKYVTAK